MYVSAPPPELGPQSWTAWVDGSISSHHPISCYVRRPRVLYLHALLLLGAFSGALTYVSLVPGFSGDIPRTSSFFSRIEENGSNQLDD